MSKAMCLGESTPVEGGGTSACRSATCKHVTSRRWAILHDNVRRTVVACSEACALLATEEIRTRDRQFKKGNI